MPGEMVRKIGVLVRGGLPGGEGVVPGEMVVGMSLVVLVGRFEQSVMSGSGGEEGVVMSVGRREMERIDELYPVGVWVTMARGGMGIGHAGWARKKPKRITTLNVPLARELPKEQCRRKRSGRRMNVGD